MGLGKKLAIGVGSVLGVLVLVGAGGFMWAKGAAKDKLAKTYEVHRVDFPIPFPLTDAELDSLRAARLAAGADRKDPLAGVDVAAITNERAVERGRHLTETFYACGECHGANFGGGTMIDDPAIGQVLGANLTTGQGSRTLKYQAADWDRMVRHGVKPDGTPTPMPSKDFFMMSDRELSDIVSFIRSKPPVDHQVTTVTLGPLGTVLLATGQIELSADVHPTKHVLTHAALPPASVADANFGKHLAQTCSGCHGATFAGGPIVGGPPDWPPAKNLTPTGLAGWSYEDFLRALKEGKSKNGTALREPMATMPKFARNMTETELQALWSYIKALPPQPLAK